jgi:hypothetical protein
MSSQSISFDPATVVVTWAGGGASYVTPSTPAYGGFGYSPGDILTYAGTLFGGASPANDLRLSFVISSKGVVSSVTATGTGPATAGSRTLTIDNVRGSKMNRDAGDHTKMLKQRMIYLERRTNSPIVSGGFDWIPQGNHFRLDYLFGKLKCRDCSAGAFNLNGPQSRS